MVQEHLDLQETDFGYSLKNVPQPSRKEYLHALLSQTQSFMNRLRWKAFFILHPDEAPPEKENFGFRHLKVNYFFLFYNFHLHLSNLFV